MYFSRSVVVSALMGFATATQHLAASESLMGVASSAAMGASEAGAATSTAASMGMSTAIPSAAAGMVNTHIIQVGGPNGSLAFYPNNVQAQAGDLVQFQFHPKNHSVVQSTFDNPCVPIQNIMANKTDAFFSGFMPTNASFAATSNVLTYTVHVKDTKPMWFYCSQGMHCQAGMVGAINAPASGNKTMESFIALAAAATENLSPGQAAGSGSGSGSAGNTPPSPSAGGGAGAGAAGTSGTGVSGTAAGSSPAEQTASGASGLGSQSFFGLGAVAVAAFALL